MERELRDLWNGVSAFKQTADRFMPQIVEPQILDPEHFAGSRKSRANTLWLIGEDVLALWRLSPSNLPRFGRVFETSVITPLSRWVFRVPDQTGMVLRVIVIPT
jgi:hypothetical protein